MLLLQRYLTDLLNLFLPPEDKEALRPWWQLVLLFLVFGIGIWAIGKGR